MPRLTGKIAVDILNILSSGKVMSPKEIAIAIDAPPQYVKIKLVVMHKHVGLLVKRLSHAKYIITDWGKELFLIITQPSKSQLLEGTKQ